VTINIAELCVDLEAEQLTVDAYLEGLSEEAWLLPTPADGWLVRDQISHLCFFEQNALLALTDPVAFDRHALTLTDMVSGVAVVGDTPDLALGRSMNGTALAARWRADREFTRRAALKVAENNASARVPWYGPAMSLASFITARIMETWAHGTDISDALGFAPAASDRLAHVCLLGVRARRYTFVVNGLSDPGDPVLIDVTSPAGERWTWGPESCRDRVSGTALDLALLFTQRRRREDTSLIVHGPTAELWMSIAQAFAGPPGPGRPRPNQ
jgi:uncharacterized protein (TIGR03084 family)